MPRNDWKLFHSGYANTPFIIFKGPVSPTINSRTPLKGVQVIAEVPLDEGPRHLEQANAARLIVVAEELLDALRECRSFIADNSMSGGPSISPILIRIDTLVSKAEGRHAA